LKRAPQKPRVGIRGSQRSEVGMNENSLLHLLTYHEQQNSRPHGHQTTTIKRVETPDRKIMALTKLRPDTSII